MPLQFHLVDTDAAGPQLLAEYLVANGLTNTDFAKRCEVGPSTVVRWLDGTRCPQRAQRSRIEKLTDGKVSRFSWLSPVEAVLEKAREEWLARTADPILPIQTMAERGWKQ